ncbi:MAG: ABC transporter ATP-binding protein [Candidatus Bathyarchaeota archaeon]|nr:MAG: ABC transporter ATP-binding protein [Candidatus Bathyarchaeota archaeon]
MALLDVENLRMYYEIMRGEVKAVDNVSFQVDTKESLGLAGESGCGKTSAALSILKLLPWNGKIVGGAIRLGGEDIVKMKDSEFRNKIRWKRISMIFQGAMNALHPTYTVGHQITEAILKHEVVSKREANERATKLIELVGMESERVKRYPHELSGGMKQRAVTAMALACNPDLVIADEPTTALDVIVQAQVLKVMKELKSRLDISMIVISHDLSLISEICDKSAIMYAGRIAEYGDVVHIYKEALHPYTEKLITAFPSVIGPKTELSSIPGFPPDLLRPPPGCRFHPRCPYAMEICCKKEPSLMEVESKDHFVACHLHGGEKK